MWRCRKVHSAILKLNVFLSLWHDHVDILVAIATNEQWSNIEDSVRVKSKEIEREIRAIKAICDNDNKKCFLKKKNRN